MKKIQLKVKKAEEIGSRSQGMRAQRSDMFDYSPRACSAQPESCNNEGPGIRFQWARSD